MRYRRAEAWLGLFVRSRLRLSRAAIRSRGGRGQAEDPKRRAGFKEPAALFRAAFVRPLSWILMLGGTWRPMPGAVAQTPAPAIGPTATCAAGPDAPCPPPSGPQAWGVVGFNGYATGVRRTASASPGVRQREFDAEYGIAWNYWDSLELRVFGYAPYNLNRGTSAAAPEVSRTASASRIGIISADYRSMSPAAIWRRAASHLPGLRRHQRPPSRCAARGAAPPVLGRQLAGVALGLRH